MTPPDPTVTNAARRAQIMHTAIQVLAEHGYGGTSFARIREQARLSSTRLISYHFAGKQDLMTSILKHVIEQAGAYMGPLIHAESTLRGQLAAYIRANLRFLAEHPAATRALQEILTQPHEDWTGTASAQHTEDLLAQLFRQGQAHGEFGHFDPTVMAFTVRAAIDATVARMAHEPHLDLNAHAEELVALFDRATRVQKGEA